MSEETTIIMEEDLEGAIYDDGEMYLSDYNGNAIHLDYDQSRKLYLGMKEYYDKRLVQEMVPVTLG